MKVISATAEYTGGGIYQYGGQLDDGNYFLCFTDWEECMIKLDVNPMCEENYENSQYSDWQTKHCVGEFFAKESIRLLTEALNWIINNNPKGNYSLSEMEDALENLKLIRV